MSEKATNTIVLTVLGVELKFEPTLVAYNKALNESARTENMVGALTTYLERIVAPESREKLKTLLKTPGLPVALARKVNEKYAPELEIEIKE
ncbi:putative phage tail assembly chaperone [Providencia rettgeri]|uniref:putative phage tail assembly chaperone n=1 Tax=Providencia TaxID=586 RepID=UPI0032DBDF80